MYCMYLIGMSLYYIHLTVCSDVSDGSQLHVSQTLFYDLQREWWPNGVIGVKRSWNIQPDIQYREVNCSFENICCSIWSIVRLTTKQTSNTEITL